MKKIYKRVSEWLDWAIPNYSRIPLLMILAFNMFVYNGGRAIAKSKMHVCMEMGFEQKIPLLSGMIIIYFGCYIFWGVNYILATRKDKVTAYKFAIAEMLGKLVCFLFFIFLPTTMPRPEVNNSGFFNFMVLKLYAIDASDNLFPSIHCYVSWMCVIGIRENRSIKNWYKNFSLIMAFLVFASTLTLKQHVIVDVFAGVVLAELCYNLVEYIFVNINRHKMPFTKRA